jgi:hypothetical protein
MDDYLSAIDDVTKENYDDKARLGCVGASYGGYSAFFLAGITTIVSRHSLPTTCFQYAKYVRNNRRGFLQLL